MHAQQQADAGLGLELETEFIDVVPFRPQIQANSKHSTVSHREADPDMTSSSVEAEHDISQVEHKFPLYTYVNQNKSRKNKATSDTRFNRAEPHFKLEERRETTALPELKGPLSKELLQLEHDIPRLVKHLNQKQKLDMSETETEHLPEWTEEQLITFYHALESWSAGSAEESAAMVRAIGSGSAEQKRGIAPPEVEESLMVASHERRRLGRQARREILSGVVARLSALGSENGNVSGPSTQTSIHQAGSEHTHDAAATDDTRKAERVAGCDNTALESAPLERRALELVTHLMPKINTSQSELWAEPLPTGLLRQVEWDVLVDNFVSKGDFEGAAKVLDGMKVSRSGEESRRNYAHSSLSFTGPRGTGARVTFRGPDESVCQEWRRCWLRVLLGSTGKVE